MASFPSMVLTNAGRNMITQAQLGQEIIFTQGKYGSGTLESEQDQTTFVDLINPLLNLPIQNITSPAIGQALFTVLIDRTNLETGFFGREIGLFAKIGESGTEQLYCYTNAGAQSDFIAAGSDNTIPYHDFIDIMTIIGNATNVSIIVDQTKVYVTHSEFQTHIQLNHLWLSRQAVKLGDICYSSSMVTDSYKMMECVQTGITGTIEPTWGAAGSTVTDGTARWIVCDLRDTSVGTSQGRKVVLGTDNKIDTGLMPADVVKFANFTQSLASSGWCKLPNGLILQWGTGATSSSGWQNITFPVAFPTKCALVIPCELAAHAWSSNWMTIYGAGQISLSACTIFARYQSGATTGATAASFNYYAIGY